MSEELLKIEDLHIVYSTEEDIVYAVNGIDLEVKAGSTLGLVGETGAGKTTTALSIMQLLPDRTGFITGGKIVLDGVNITDADEATLRDLRGNTVSMIFQDPMTSLNPTIPVGEQIAEVIELHNPDWTQKQVESRVDELMQLIGLPSERKTEFPHQFSGGMKQRIVIAIALACEPKLLLADEPTTALDVTIQAQVLVLMKELKEKLNTSMILITHDLGVVAQTCDNVAIMYAGEIIEVGTSADVFKGKQHHPYTEGLFGAIPNLTQKEHRLHPIDGLMPDPTNLPVGCCFSPRCPQCSELCKQRKPGIYVNDTHKIKCHLFAKEALDE